jgi:hypothetical protein
MQDPVLRHHVLERSRRIGTDWKPPSRIFGHHCELEDAVAGGGADHLLAQGSDEAVPELAGIHGGGGRVQAGQDLGGLLMLRPVEGRVASSSEVTNARAVPATLMARPKTVPIASRSAGSHGASASLQSLPAAASQAWDTAFASSLSRSEPRTFALA